MACGYGQQLRKWLILSIGESSGWLAVIVISGFGLIVGFSEGSVHQMIQGLLSLVDQHLRIKDILKDGFWDWDCLSCEIPQHIKYIIQATLCALTSTGGDRLA